MKSLRIKIYPNVAQRKILKEWADTSRYVYNRTVRTIKVDKAKVCFESLRDRLVTKNTKKGDPEYVENDKVIAELRAGRAPIIKVIKAGLTKTQNKIKKDGKDEPIMDYYARVSAIEPIPRFAEHLAAIHTINGNIARVQAEFADRKKLLDGVRNTKVGDWELKTPKDVRAGAVDDVCKAYKTIWANLNAGNIRYFELKYRKKNKQQTILIPKTKIKLSENLDSVSMSKSFFKENNIFELKTRTIKMLKKKYPNLKITHDVRLTSFKNEYWLNIPVDIEIAKKKIIANGSDGKVINTYCGVDPGVRTFMTTYGNDGTREYTNNRKILVKKLQTKISELDERKCNINKILTSNIVKRQQMLSIRRKNAGYIMARKLKTKIKKEKRRCELKIAHVIDELHWKTIRDLTKCYDCIFYGDIKSHDIVKGKKNHTLNTDVNALKFYKFKTRLLYKAEALGNKVILVHEANTTKTCSCCGNIKHNVGASKTYYCDNANCNAILGRDINSAKNMLIKGLMVTE